MIVKLRVIKLTEKLRFYFTVVPHKAMEWNVARVTETVLGNITIIVTDYRFDSLVVAQFIV